MSQNTTPTARGRITIDLFTTLDLVSQGPGGPDEDPSGGFRFGGWQAPLMDTRVGEWVDAGMQTMDALVLGRRTYEIFAGYWPQREDAPGGEVARLFNRIPKYVATRDDALPLTWDGTSRLGEDVPGAIERLRAAHRDVHVIGSIDFAQTLLADGLYDELKLWVYPVVLGEGKKVFPDGAVPSRLRLLAPPEVSEQGVVMLRYAPLPGVPGTGDMSE